MSRLIAIDPGVKMCGFAKFIGGRLVDAGVLRATKTKELNDKAQYMAYLITQYMSIIGGYTLAIERMRVYNKLQQKGDPNDLLDVAYVSGVIAGRVARYTHKILTPTAREWKGTIEKPIHHERIKRDCPQAEPLAQKTAKTYRHNVYDAIGLGLWAIERIGR